MHPLCLSLSLSPPSLSSRMDSPEDLYNSGIFINDLSMHDSSRDFNLAGSQQNPELNLALNQVSGQRHCQAKKSLNNVEIIQD